ncbi:hypothetical protein ACH40F_29160 [Streptomyces sp. NPDC020794]|uniref:hypothetical protein n=1 Tax=unclassified Streptomyces TaxID=2593676 RepID=UPI0036E2CE53
MKTYRRHNCQTRHTTWGDLAHCTWLGATVLGDGPYAAIACRAEAVTLYPTHEQAAARRQAHDRDGCGPACGRRHDVVLLDPVAEPTTTA